jgi:hypothetical protein
MSILSARWFPIPDKAKQQPIQQQLTKDLFEKKYSEYIITAGRRSFKTERFIKRYAIKRLTEDKFKTTFIGAPTRIQAKGIFWKDLKALTPQWLNPKISESELSISTKDGNELKVIGLQEFKRVQGQLCHLALISEYQECDPDVWNESFFPMINDTNGIAIKEGRPYGKNHFYDDYLKGLQPNNKIKSYHWTSEDILSAEQIEDAKSRLGKSDYQREYLASFETDSQSPYYSYTHLNNASIPIRYDLPFILTCDFNATTKPMSWVFGQDINEVTYWHKTFSNKYTNTLTQCEIVSDYFNSLPGKSNKLILYGDYTGKAKESNSSYSDWEIIQDYFRNTFDIEQRTKPTKSIRDSVASTNARLCNMNGIRKMFINENECKELKSDWEKCEWAVNGKQLVETDDRGHICRAVDYFSDYEYSIKGEPETTWNH